MFFQEKLIEEIRKIYNEYLEEYHKHFFRLK